MVSNSRKKITCLFGTIYFSTFWKCGYFKKLYLEKSEFLYDKTLSLSLSLSLSQRTCLSPGKLQELLKRLASCKKQCPNLMVNSKFAIGWYYPRWLKHSVFLGLENLSNSSSSSWLCSAPPYDIIFRVIILHSFSLNLSYRFGFGFCMVG